jgi:hypothetical protein
MELSRLLYERIAAAHRQLGAPVEEYDEFMAGDGTWTFHAVGSNGGIGIHARPEKDGDSMVVVMPTRLSYGATMRAMQVIRDHLATGRKLYTMAWKTHVMAININLRIGGEVLGFDDDGFYHFCHSSSSLRSNHRGQKEHADPA